MIDAINMLEKPWQRGVSILEIAPKGKDFVDITECVDMFDVSIIWGRAKRADGRLSFWYESSNINMTKQIFLSNEEIVVEFQYKYYPDGKEAPYCVGEMLLPSFPGAAIFIEGSILRFIPSGNPEIGKP